MIQAKDEIEKLIIDSFEENYEALRIETDRTITSFAKDMALEQIIHYWRKLNEIAKQVTETEVRLILSNQATPEGRKYSIEGIVDIVQQGSEIWLYDLKTQNADFIREKQDVYEDQLNIYAHIWEHLEDKKLTSTGVICTSLPRQLRNALKFLSPTLIEHEFKRWEPIIKMNFSEENVQNTIKKFGEVVDHIENHDFEPPSEKKLAEVGNIDKVTFATRVCRNCDVRFSCPSYISYVIKRGDRSQSGFKKFFAFAAVPDEDEQEEWVSGNLTSSEEK